MKTTKILLSGLAILLASTVFATKIPTMKITPTEANKPMLAFEIGSTAGFELTVENLKGETLYYKKSETPVENYRTVFNFSELNDGFYQVRFSSENCTLNRKLTISGEKIKVGEEVRLLAPFYSFEKNILSVSFLNKGQKNVLLNIYHDGQHVAGRKLGKELCIQKALDFSKLEKGTYDVVLSDYFKDYQFTVSK